MKSIQLIQVLDLSWSLRDLNSNIKCSGCLDFQIVSYPFVENEIKWHHC